jgi:DNA methylase
MMDERSWWRLEADPPQHRLPEDLRARDPFNGRDCGWVSQMRPFVRGYSQPGDVVFDPFCGFGTTLLAAALEDRVGAGMEIDTFRASLARERLRRHGITAQIVEGALPSTDIPQRIDLCLTSVPYFGCRWTSTQSSAQTGESRSDAQLYAAPHFAAYLEGLRAVFHAVRKALPEDGYCIAMAENVRIGERTLPVAWELARILDSLFLACDERVLCYPPRSDAPQDDANAMPNSDRNIAEKPSDRTHEYALIYRKRRASIDIERTRALLAALRDAMFDVEVHGSFSAWTHATPADAVPRPHDLDLWVSEEAIDWSRLLQCLCARGYRLTLWGEPVNTDVTLETVRAHGYLRAERIDADGGMVRLDLSLRPS